MFQENCEFIVALTHMRMHNDRRLAECVTDIDIILGGHDHHYDIEYVNNVPIVKSGSDFRNFSEISVTITDTDKRCLFDFKKHTITRDITEVVTQSISSCLLLLLFCCCCYYCLFVIILNNHIYFLHRSLAIIIV